MGLTPDHEVITIDGWKRIAAVLDTDLVGCYNIATNEFEWHHPTRRSTRELPPDEPLYKLFNDRIKIICDIGQLFRCEDRFGRGQLISAEEFRAHPRPWCMRHNMHTAGDNVNPTYMWEEIDFMPPGFFAERRNRLDWCRFMAFMLGDGGVGLDVDPDLLQRSQSLNKPECYEWLEELMYRLQLAAPDVFSGIGISYQEQICKYRLRHVGLARIFEPMCRGPLGFDPLNNRHIHEYDHAVQIAQVGNVANPAHHNGQLRFDGDWRYLKRWFGCYAWARYLDGEQARAFLQGYSVADGQLSYLIDAMGVSLVYQMIDYLVQVHWLYLPARYPCCTT